MKIYLCGFMGSGKTTLRRKWAQEFGEEGLTFDFDGEIFIRQARHHKHLGEVIDEFGWNSFRRWETELLKETLESSQIGFFSLGGGALEEERLDLILRYREARLVWLNTSVEECWRRCAQKNERPIVEKGKLAFVELYQSRLKTYRMAHLVLSEEEQKNWSFEKLKEALREGN